VSENIFFEGEKKITEKNERNESPKTKSCGKKRKRNV
jgi:hypothetical protein